MIGLASYFIGTSAQTAYMTAQFLTHSVMALTYCRHHQTLFCSRKSLQGLDEATRKNLIECQKSNRRVSKNRSQYLSNDVIGPVLLCA